MDGAVDLPNEGVMVMNASHLKTILENIKFILEEFRKELLELKEENEHNLKELSWMKVSVLKSYWKK